VREFLGGVANAFEVAVEFITARKRAARHVINSLSVYEGVDFPTRSPKTYQSDIANWVRAALIAYKRNARELGIPDIVHAHGRFLTAGAAALALTDSEGIPYVYTEHSSWFLRNKIPIAAVPLLKRVLNKAAACTAVSSQLFAAMERVVGSPITDGSVLPNVLDPLFEQTPMSARPSPTPFLFLCVASLYEYKRVEVLLESFYMAFSGDIRYRLSICGDGPCRGQLEAIVAKLGLSDSVHLLGQRSKEQVLAEMDASHVIVLPSAVETFGVVLIEAFARGLPAVATRCGGPMDIVDEASGILVPVDDTDAMSLALRTMHLNYSDYDSASIRENAIARFGADAFLGRIDALIARTLQYLPAA
jgi:glycosyltransferase involved in cell wall biosynthesis